MKKRFFKYLLYYIIWLFIFIIVNSFIEFVITNILGASISILEIFKTKNFIKEIVIFSFVYLIICIGLYIFDTISILLLNKKLKKYKELKFKNNLITTWL